ncbi:hypothetical protein CANARDRAFT_6912 [[Candida] arabinofermentans NRRL YB-2248]|uniref:Maintenance of telomere capping protein 6 n=1 Tax=[Candida] arabinofermentans NRRL YB-2248 TaxID=983967 RepID=A0A1E4T3V7_9ASCO|nr:hypothetical protein CANARDRAFT_6912 [[Candida] arabinofermentans NRRL YB-2248]
MVYRSVLATLLYLVIGIPMVSSMSSLASTTNTEWPTLSTTRAIAMRTQRDISKNITVTDNVVFGVDLNKVVFDLKGYNSSSLTTLRDLLNVGAQALVVDLYYNEYFKDWGLCDTKQLYSNSTLPCGSPSTFNITSIFSVVNDFIADTDTKLSANLMYIAFHLHSIYSVDPNFQTGIQSLETQIETLDEVSSPSLVSDTDFPSLNQFVFEDHLRIIPVVLSSDLYSNTTFSLGSLSAYVSNDTIQTEYKALGSVACAKPATSYDPELSDSVVKFSYDSDALPYTVEQFRASMLCGYIPIISHELSTIEDITPYLTNSFWSWAANEPNVTTSSESRSVFSTGTDDDDDSDDDNLYLNRCAVLTTFNSSSGWKANSCTRKHRVLCQSKQNSSHYKLTKEESTYFEADDTCGDGYKLTVPKTAIDQRYFLDLIGGNATAWIDMNSLKSSNCWVSGGVDADCPYQKIISVKIFKEMIIPSSVIAFLILLGIVGLQFDGVVGQRNRKNWKKLLNEKLKDEFEGIPA